METRQDQSKCYRPIEPRDLMGEEFHKLSLEKQIDLVASACAGVMDSVRMLRRDVETLLDHQHGGDGTMVIPLLKARYR